MRSTFVLGSQPQPHPSTLSSVSQHIPQNDLLAAIRSVLSVGGPGKRQEGRGRGGSDAGWGNESSCPVFESRESSAVLLPNIHPITHSGSTLLIVLWGPSPTLHPCNPGELAPVSASQCEHATQASRIRAKPEIYDGSIRKYTFCFYSACYVGRLYAC